MNAHYIPQPVDMNKVELPADVMEITELLAKNTHEVWAQQRIAEGWTYGKERNDERKKTPCLVSYEELPESEKVYDRNTALETVRLLLYFGYKITPVCKKLSVKLPGNAILDDGSGAVSIPDRTNPSFWASNKALPNEKDFMRIASHCFLMLDADVLRNSGAMISKAISWERSVMNLIWQLNNNTAIRYLLKAPHLLITFEEDAIVYIKTEKTGNKRIVKSASMVLADGSCEGAWRREHPSGNDFAARVAAAALQFADVVNKRKKLQLMPVLKNSAIEKVNDDDENLITVPILKDGNTIDPNTWLIANSKTEKDSHELAVNYINQGDDSLKGKGFPILKMGKLKSIDRFEIEGYHNIRNLMIEYANKKFSEGEEITPLSIAVFGSPGSGKSFGVKQIAKSLKECNIKTDTVNVAQISSDDELGATFQKVRDIILEDKLPLIFFDEFDSGDLKWLKNFLMPMQDGKFKDASGEHPLGKCILVFAGGTASTFKDFVAPINSADEQTQRAFKNVKGPDFASRIKGTIDIAGPNRRDDSDNAYILRRALLLRSLCERDKRLEKNALAGEKFIDENILRAMLYVPEYKHGARSMETILKMSKIEKGVWLPSGLPIGSQMSVHLDDRKFTDILLIKEMEQSLEGVMAKAIHEFYLSHLDETDRNNPNNVKWEELPILSKIDNLMQAREYPDYVGKLGGKIDFAGEEGTVLELTDEAVVEELAMQEHVRWVEAKEKDGWKAGKPRDNQKKIHDCLFTWDELDEKTKDKDRNPIREIPQVLASVGKCVYKK
jgi:hypothetical protein